MKIKKSIVLGMVVFLLSGCSLLDGLNNSLDYANNTKDYVDNVTTFAEEIRSLSGEAVANEDSRIELENKLTEMKEEIQVFNEQEPPAIAEGIHEQIVGYNQSLDEGITLYLDNIEKGQLEPQILEDSNILQTIDQISSIKEQLNQLGQ
ncbi:DUF6376 family protein [Metabacillus herbersteinensis]|uniref:DUF6376 family protein n=1 Tax=Metabacillus herbersteinensis TaxID=283816 RepID=A0ABV6GKE1_9BACI